MRLLTAPISAETLSPSDATRGITWLLIPIVYLRNESLTENRIISVNFKQFRGRSRGFKNKL